MSTSVLREITPFRTELRDGWESFNAFFLSLNTKVCFINIDNRLY